MKKGFTLIELLVVVLIIGILAAIALPQYTKTVEKSKLAEAEVMLKGLSDAYERYLLENNAPPTTLEELDIAIPGTIVTDNIIETKNFGYGFTTDSVFASRYTSTGTPKDDWGLAILKTDKTSTNYNKAVCWEANTNAYDKCKKMGFSKPVTCESMGDDDHCYSK